MYSLPAENLAKVYSNTMKFVDPKSQYLPGKHLTVLTENSLRSYACDDYFAVVDYSTLTSGGQEDRFVLNLEDVKMVEEFARKNKKHDIFISVSGDDVTFTVGDNKLACQKQEYWEEIWEYVDHIIYTLDVVPVILPQILLRPERVSKISQLKAEKEAPWAVRVVDIDGVTVLQFRLGSTIRGAVKPVSIEKVIHEYTW